MDEVVVGGRWTVWSWSQDARQRIELMRRRWQAEQAAIWAIARAGRWRSSGPDRVGDVDLDDGSAKIVY
ncbi:hypothetical protein [Streptomyces odontomachi]|uniref:hypothetical protein n=1 Tax=Streptomyces odontomachi TaxID=2944940 RepID=UPI00210BFEFC|nr:hypothetical protein [Streptomyces sp. ODS25]